MSNDCSICYNSYNKSTRAKVVCFGCDFQACRECLAMYLTTVSTNLTADCPGCHKEWTREFLLQSFTQKFVNTDIKHHREEILFQREQAMLPLRQIELERRNRISGVEEQLLDIHAQINALYNVRDELRAQLEYLKNRNKEPEPDKQTFVQKCPNGECRGFLSTQWKCGLCEKWTCQECKEVKGDRRDAEHTCDPDTVATAKLISSETKPCPKCGVRLYKISGCNQMWCTSCNDCAFDWVTGKIEKVIHNPHYFEYQRRLRGGADIPRQLGDLPCGGALQIDHRTPYNINDHLRTLITKPSVKSHMDLLDNICQMYIHVQITMVPKYTLDAVRFNQEYGISFLSHDITEQEFKIHLQRADKRVQQARETRNVLDMVLTTTSDLVARYNVALTELGVRTHPDRSCDEAILAVLAPTFAILHEIDPLLEYANECLVKIAKVYGSKSNVVVELDTERTYYGRRPRREIWD
jgi:hypothetical protein